MGRKVRRFFRIDEGVTSIEYGFIGSFAAAVIAASVSLGGTKAAALYNTAAALFTG
ncbi:MAG: Flp family type IVb pilin [Syntrophorhabdales bacterium]|jgi:Flp pilus assembly pilin Flp